MKVTLLTSSDYSNASYELQQCLRSVGLEAKAFKKKRHRFNYSNEAILFSEDPSWRKWLEDSDVVIFMHSEFIKTKVSLKNKKIYVKHTGSRYRQHSREINKIFNPIVNATLSAGDALGKGAVNEIWILQPINARSFQPVYREDFSKKIVIGHYPTRDKGTEIIKSTISSIESSNFIFKSSLDPVIWKEQLERIRECDIYIGAMDSHQKDIPLYIFGITVLESACLGKIIINRFPMKSEYEKRFGKCAIFSSQNEEELRKQIKQLLDLPGEEFLRIQKETREWVERCHSYQTIGKKYIELFKTT